MQRRALLLSRVTENNASSVASRLSPAVENDASDESPHTVVRTLSEVAADEGLTLEAAQDIA
jgi:hypothetical protein